MTDQLQATKAIVRRCLEEFLGGGDPSVADQLVAPEFIDHNLSNPDLPGRENVKRSVRDWCAAVPDTHTVDDLIAAADRVAAAPHQDDVADLREARARPRTRP